MRADQAIEMLKTLPSDQQVTVIVGTPAIAQPFYVPADPYWYNHGFRITCKNETENKTS